MGLIELLATVAGVTVKNVGSLVLIASQDVEAFLRAAQVHNVAIIGVEGFQIEEDHVIPDMDVIADFSSFPHDDRMVTATIEETKRFVVEVARQDMCFDFTIEARGKGSEQA